MGIEFPEEQKILELGRKSFHTGVGITVIIIFLIFGRYYTSLLVLVALLIGILLSEVALRGFRIPFITDCLIVFDRPEDIRFRPGFGVMTLFVGFAIALIFPYLPGISIIAQDIPFVCRGFLFGNFLPCWKMDQWALITIGAMLPSTFADTSSTIGGIYLGRHKWRYNPRKSIEGSIFNLFVAILVISLVAPYHLAILAGMGVMIVESLPHVDDNMNIPIVASFILSLGFIYF